MTEPIDAIQPDPIADRKQEVAAAQSSHKPDDTQTLDTTSSKDKVGNIQDVKRVPKPAGPTFNSIEEVERHYEQTGVKSAVQQKKEEDNPDAFVEAGSPEDPTLGQNGAKASVEEMQARAAVAAQTGVQNQGIAATQQPDRTTGQQQQVRKTTVDEQERERAAEKHPV